MPQQPREILTISYKPVGERMERNQSCDLREMFAQICGMRND